MGIILLSACGTPLPVESKQTSKELPSWITSPQNDSVEYMYGVAINRDRKTALQDALVNMVSKLGVSIESSFESNQEVHKYYEKSVATNKIKADVAKIKINNYEIVQSQQISYREFAVMIRTDKKKFVDGLVEELNSKKKSMELKAESLKGENALTRYNVKKELSLESSALTSSILIISELDKNFDKKRYLNFVSKIQTEFLNEQKNLSFYVYGDKKSASFVENIKNYLTQKGFKLNSIKSKNSVAVELSTLDNISTEGYMNIAVLNVRVDVYNNAQRIGGKSIILKERYNGSKQNVYKNASIHLEQDIESLGINEAIGINIHGDK
jgi:hypothetical protein